MAGHSDRQRTYRPDDAEYTAARAELRRRNISLTRYLRAALRWVAADPERALDALEPMLPPERALGRPSGDRRRAEAAARGA
ncbi:hypothetical protein [Mycolicibacterium peregrinum]|uniref:hypothetical protein n=1 Tax=Mycolicibacterium peregrinum TaxID=43304 RepID=UPI001056D3FA|nr:hypothetical protein [Mycolicibacterium peregrinum]